MAMVFEVGKAYRDRPHTVFALWVAGLPLVLQLFSGVSISQMMGTGVFLSSLFLFLFAFSASYFLQEMDEATPFAMILLVGVSAGLVKVGVQWMLGQGALFDEVLALEAAVLAGMVSMAMPYCLDL